MVYANAQLYWLRLNQVITMTWRDNLAILLRFLSYIIALQCNKPILHCTLYVNNSCPENMETAALGWQTNVYANAAAILEIGCHGNQNANLQWPNIQITSKYIKLFVCAKCGACITK